MSHESYIYKLCCSMRHPLGGYYSGKTRAGLCIFFTLHSDSSSGPERGQTPNSLGSARIAKGLLSARRHSPPKLTCSLYTRIIMAHTEGAAGRENRQRCEDV